VAQDFRYAENTMKIPASGSPQLLTIGDATSRVEFVTQAREAASITTLKFYYGVRALTPVTHKIGFRTPNAATGKCDGAYLTGTGEASASFTPPASTAWDNTWQTVTLTATTFAVTRGQNLCITIEPTGVPSGGNTSSFGWSATSAGVEGTATDYVWTVATGTYTHRGDLPMIGYGNGSRMFGFPYTYSQVTFDVGTSPDEFATRFKYMCPVGCTYKVAGLKYYGKIAPASTSTKFQLYNGTTVLNTVTFDNDYSGGWGGNVTFAPVFFTDTNLSSLTCQSVYRVGIQPQNAGSFFVAAADYPAASDIDSAPYGLEYYTSSRTDVGAWTDTTTRRMAILPIIDSIQCSAGGTVPISTILSGGHQ
jgi:hypothetical protein